MATQRLVHAIPIEVQPMSRLAFTRARLQDGVSIQRAVGPLARKVADRTSALPVQPGFVPTHLIVVDQSPYLAALDSRLATAGTRREKRERESVDLAGIYRQVLTSITLLGKCVWTVGGAHTFDSSDPKFPHSSVSYSHRPKEAVSPILWYSASSDWFSNVYPRELRNTCEILDCYYRTGSWWVDPLGVALGYFWSGLTSPHPELAFVAFCMALEAIASTSSNEITHILAERCAVLAHPPGPARMEMYSQVRDLYRLRSKIVHGRSAPRKGLISWETLAITAKASVVPSSQVLRMVAVTAQVLNSVISRPSLLQILHTRQNEDKTSRALDAYFLGLLLSG